jgi:Arc/MetJ-type ribon-helix-helix transcriptional regulator
MFQGMTKTIEVSLREELYDWAAREVEEGRAESVSALIAEGLALLQARAELEAVVTDLRREAGELADQEKARLAEALAAADETCRPHRSGGAARVAWKWSWPAPLSRRSGAVLHDTRSARPPTGSPRGDRADYAGERAGIRARSSRRSRMIGAARQFGRQIWRLFSRLAPILRAVSQAGGP